MSTDGLIGISGFMILSVAAAFFARRIDREHDRLETWPLYVLTGPLIVAALTYLVIACGYVAGYIHIGLTEIWGLISPQT